MPSLPNDVFSFVQQGKQLDFPVHESIVGPIKLKTFDQLAPGQVSVCSLEADIDDPYRRLEGSYKVDAYDLIEESERYIAEGLLVWLISQGKFATIDIEHGTVIVFPNATWSDIVKHPLYYLDAQWTETTIDSQQLLPWLHFDFVLWYSDIVLKPYPSLCPVHNLAVFNNPAIESDFLATAKLLASEDWLLGYTTTFPCCGVPISEDDVLCCLACRKAEEEWVESVYNECEAVDIVPNSDNWATCPNCNRRFSLDDRNIFKRNVHLYCGQKVRVKNL